MIFAAVIIIAVTVLAFVVLLYAEQRDKTARERQKLPARQYHDITDHDVITVYTISHK